jgi:hypothetical protein
VGGVSLYLYLPLFHKVKNKSGQKVKGLALSFHRFFDFLKGWKKMGRKVKRKWGESGKSRKNRGKKYVGK